MPSCKLCGKQEPRLRRSHVVPRFILRGTDTQARQRERLLCGDCETVLGRIESVAAQLVREDNAHPLLLALLSAIALRAHYSKHTCYAPLRLRAREVQALRRLLLHGRAAATG